MEARVAQVVTVLSSLTPTPAVLASARALVREVASAAAGARASPALAAYVQEWLAWLERDVERQAGTAFAGPGAAPPLQMADVELSLAEDLLEFAGQVTDPGSGRSVERNGVRSDEHNFVSVHVRDVSLTLNLGTAHVHQSVAEVDGRRLFTPGVFFVKRSNVAWARERRNREQRFVLEDPFRELRILQLIGRSAVFSDFLVLPTIAGECGGFLYSAAPYARYGNLHDYEVRARWRNAQGAQPTRALSSPAEVGLHISLLAQHVASALAFLHARGVVHRDVSCYNIVVDLRQPDGLLMFKLVDLGMAVGVPVRAGAVVGAAGAGAGAGGGGGGEEGRGGVWSAAEFERRRAAWCPLELEREGAAENAAFGRMHYLAPEVRYAYRQPQPVYYNARACDCFALATVLLRSMSRLLGERPDLPVALYVEPEGPRAAVPWDHRSVGAKNFYERALQPWQHVLPGVVSWIRALGALDPEQRLTPDRFLASPGMPWAFVDVP